MGRFITPDTYIQDPADPQTFNRYSYVQNNPVNLVDPTGNFSWGKLFFIAAVAFIGAFTGGLAFAALTAQGFGFVAASTIAGAIGGAVSGAISGGVQGGFKGALKGAALGAATGAALGLGGAVFGRGFAIAALAAGGAYSYKKEGWEGVAYFAAGVAGGAAGFASGASTGQDVFGNPPEPTNTQTTAPKSVKTSHNETLEQHQLAVEPGTRYRADDLLARSTLDNRNVGKAAGGALDVARHNTNIAVMKNKINRFFKEIIKFSKTIPQGETADGLLLFNENTREIYGIIPVNDKAFTPRNTAYKTYRIHSYKDIKNLPNFVEGID